MPADPARPIWLRSSPAISAPTSGAAASTIKRFWLITLAPRYGFPGWPRRRERGIACNGFACGLSLVAQRIKLADVDRAAVAEHQHDDGKADGRFRGRHRQDEEHEHLSRRIAEEARERDEVRVDGQQHQLDAHQQHDHVLAVDEDARDRDAEQHRREHDVPGKRNAHACGSSAGSGTDGGAVGVTAAIFTMRTRPAARVADCAAGFWCLENVRTRSANTTAATKPTVSINAAISNGSRKCVNSAVPSHSTVEAPAGFGPACTLKARTPMMPSISISMITAAPTPTGRYLVKPSRNGSRSMSSIITTNRNSTITAPTYTTTSARPRNSASARIHRHAVEKNVSTSASTAWTVFFTDTTASAAPTATTAKAMKQTIWKIEWVMGITCTPHPRRDWPRWIARSGRPSPATAAW